MSQEIAKAYEPRDVESRWYAEWLRHGAFAPAGEGRDVYSVVIPPPNVTGVLTMGHVLNNTLQDILVRRARLEGRSAMWLPGTDHAGIATQTVVERQLRREGLKRRDLGREKFLEHVWAWREKHGDIILEQLQRLGCSCDWDRLAFTMDPGYSRRVLHVFVELFNRGRIYRGQRMVNWCPVSLTALSDEEVVMKASQGVLYRMRYEIVDRPGEYVEIATTRPETLMGDTAVAVHPDDKRYRDLVGGHVWRPFPREKIPVVADRHIDPEFGTGVLKVTPAHDKADFEIGRRHGLPVCDIFNPDGTLNELAGSEFAGVDRFEARKVAAAKLRELGLLVKEEPYEHNVGYSERADVPIEPRLSEQWFLRYPKVDEAKAAVRDGAIRFHPDRWSKVYLNWMENIQDWCISRQLWWGHRIPVWYRKGIDRDLLSDENLRDPGKVHVSIDGPPDPENWEREEDVLDTWFSSWLWPFATMGWLDAAEEERLGLHRFYPTTTLVTGPDIIFFWVARMIMAGLEFMNPGGSLERRVPFRNVYFTGIIRDAQGRKMSKSLGNSPDPLDLIDKYGADGLRIGIVSIAPQGQDIRFVEERIEGGRNFCNKLWNACRFRQVSGAPAGGGDASAILRPVRSGTLDADDHAILRRLVEVTRELEDAFASFEFSAAVQRLHAFFWNDFCDWYVEVSKTKLEDASLRGATLAVQDFALRQLLLLLHPFVPFITEELWSRLGYGSNGKLLQESRLLSADELEKVLGEAGVRIDDGAAARVAALKSAVTEIRALKAELNLASRRDLTLLVVADDDHWNLLEESGPKFFRMAGLRNAERRSALDGSPGRVTAIGTVFFDLHSTVDVDAEVARLRKELETIDGHIAGAEKRLGNPSFVDKAPPAVVEGARRQLADLQTKRTETERLLSSLSDK